MRAWRSSGCILTFMLLTAGCSNATEVDTISKSAEVRAEATVTPNDVETENAWAPTFRSYRVKGTTPDGVPVDVTVELDPTLYTTEEVTDPLWADVVSQCGVDSERDAVVVGQVSMEFDSSGFDEGGSVNVFFFPPNGERMWFDGSTNAELTNRVAANDPDDGAFGWGYGVGYTDTDCYYNVTTGPEAIYSTYPEFRVSASFAGDESDWGPVPVAFITPGYRGPKHPDGNPYYEEIFSHVAMCVGTDTSDPPLCAGDLNTPGGTDSVSGSGREKRPNGGTWFAFMSE